MMKKIAVATALTSVLFISACKQGADAEEPKANLDAEEGRVAYSLGYTIGSSLANDFQALDFTSFYAGVKAAYSEGEPAMSEEDMQKVIQDEQQNVMKRREEQRQKDMEAAKAEAAKVLEENGKKEGVTTTESGLQYEVITEGEGASPSETDEVTVHYHGTLLDGTVFDSSVDRGQPATFALNRVIKGWTEGVQLMKVGSKYKFTIPSELAYGERGAGPKIGPNSVLVFEVELLSITGDEAEPAAE